MMFFVLFLISLMSVQNSSLVEKIQNRFEEVNSIEAEFTQSANSMNSISGKFYFLRENNYRIELKNNTIISDGKSIWNIDSKRKKVVISNIEDDPLAFSLYDYIYNYPSKCEVSEEGLKNGSLLILDAGKSNLKFKVAKLWVTPDYIIEKILVTDFSENSFIFKFDNIELNRNLKPELFAYKSNGDNKIIDLR